MSDAPGPASFAGLRDAVLKGREPPPLRAVARLPAYRWLVVGSVCIGAFMGQLDASIAQLVLPRLEIVFDARLSSVSWVAIAYLLTLAGFLPIFGRLADMVGRKLLYTGGFLLFVLGSGLAGLAPSLPAMIAFRIMQGIGAAMLAANSVAIVVTAAGPQRRGRALGIQAAAQAVGLSVGPALGGLLLDTLDWRWVFWINVPVGLVGAVIGWFVIPPTGKLENAGRFDWTGAVLLLPALAALMAAINNAHAWGFTSPAVLACAVAGIVLMALFVRSQRRHGEPLVDLSLFRGFGFSMGNMAGLMGYGMLFGLFFLMPFLLIRAYGETALEAGLRLSIVPVMLSLAAPFSGALSDRLGARRLTVSGMAICTIALVVLYIVVDGKASSLPVVMLALGAVGLGQGLFTSPNNNSIMAAAPERLTGEAGGLMNVTRSIGTSLGVAAAATCLSWQVEVVTGSGDGRTSGVAAGQLAEAGGAVLLLLAAFAAMAAAISLMRPHSRPSPGQRSRVMLE